MLLNKSEIRDCGETGVWLFTIRSRYQHYARGHYNKHNSLRQCFIPPGGIEQRLADDKTPTTIDEALLKLRAGLHSTLQANGCTLQHVDSGCQIQTGDCKYDDLYNTPAILFDTPQMVFND